MTVPFGRLNEEVVAAQVAGRGRIAHAALLERQRARLLEEGGHRLRFLPVHFVFDPRARDELAAAARALIGAQTRILRHLAGEIGREGILRRFRVPEAMRRFVDWDELLDPRCLVARFDVLEAPDGHRFCEFNVDSCVAAAEVFELAAEYLGELGVRVEELGPTPPLRRLAGLLAETAERLGAARVVILDWSAGGGSPGKGYLSFERMRGHLARAIAPVPVFVRDEQTFDRDWLTPAEARRTLVFRGFMMDEMDDGGTFLDRLLALGARVVGTYETEIRMNKLWFALLHDPALSAVLAPGERELVARYIPWSCAIDERNLGSLIERRQRFIFKEKQSFGGRGILLGEATSAAELAEVLAGDGAEGWIAQELLDVVPASFPHDERFEERLHRLVFGLYLYGEQGDGMLVRASTRSKIVNVTMGDAKLAWAFCVDEAARSALLAGLREGACVGA